MMNEHVWKLYIKSIGDKMAALFRDNLSDNISREYADAIKHLHCVYCAAPEIVNDTHGQLLELCEYIAQSENIPSEALINSDVITSYEEADAQIDSIFGEWYQARVDEASGNEKDLFSWFTGAVAYISTTFAIDCPDLFVPYYFYSNYNVFSIIADTFGIELPPIPKKSDYRARVWHYAEICKALFRFRQQKNLSAYELCAFLYDFAPNYIGGTDSYIVRDLPVPKSAYFIGGGGNNADAQAEDRPENIVRWQCNPGTCVGDMIVMYLRTPISAITSIWRSHSIGFIDPFIYYYRCTYVGNPEKVNPLSFDAIKADPILGQMPIVSKNMQGINGIESKQSAALPIIDSYWRQKHRREVTRNYWERDIPLLLHRRKYG